MPYRRIDIAPRIPHLHSLAHYLVIRLIRDSAYLASIYDQNIKSLSDFTGVTGAVKQDGAAVPILSKRPCQCILVCVREYRIHLARPDCI